MEFIVPAICGLLFIIGIVAVVMSRSNWRIPQMILVFFILLFSLAFFYMAARNLRARKAWEDEVSQYKDKIKETQEGDPNLAIKLLSVKRDELRHRLVEATAERGRVWIGAIKDKINPANGQITASFDQQEPKGLEPDKGGQAVVFVFEEADTADGKGGKYLGEFSVSSAQGKQVVLTPAGTPVQSELNSIAASKGPWDLYEIMPGDNHTLFAEAVADDPNALKKLLPQSSREEYARDRKPAKYDVTKYPEDQPKESDPADRVRVLVKFLKPWPETAAAAPMAPAAPPAEAGAATDAAKAAGGESFKAGDIAYVGVVLLNKANKVKLKDLEKDGVVAYENSDPAKFLIYERPLHDYARAFRDQYRERNELFNQKAEIDAQLAQIDTATKQVDDDIKTAQSQKDGLTKDLTKFKAELETVIAFNKSLDAKIADTRAKLSELFKANLKLSGQLADIERRIYDAIRAKSPPAEASASVGR